MSKPHHQIVMFILFVLLVAACETAPSSSEAPVAELPVPTATESTSAVAQTPALPTATTLPVAATDLPPSTMVPPTEDVLADTNQDAADVMEVNEMNIAVGDNVLMETMY